MDAILREHLITMADRLAHDPERDPAAIFTAADRRTLADDITCGYPALLLDFIPRIIEPITCGEYADRLRKIAGVR